MNNRKEKTSLELKKLKEENQILKKRLNLILSRIKENEELEKKIRKIEKKLISNLTAEDVITSLSKEMKEDFKIPFFSIVISSLYHPIFSLKRIDELILRDITDIQKFFTKREAIIIQNPSLKIVSFFYGNEISEIKSLLLLPFMFQGELVGSINLASDDPNRYRPGISTDFLGRLAIWFSISLENSIVHEHLLKLSFTDFLTGIKNRLTFDIFLEHEVKRARRYCEDLTLIMMDIDNFKEINDTFGHKKGDELLKKVAKVLSENTRETDLVARFGGDEFVLLLPTTTLDSSEHIAAKLKKKLANIKIDENNKLHVSMGIASLSEESVINGENLLQLADSRLYKEKAKKGNKLREKGFNKGEP